MGKSTAASRSRLTPSQGSGSTGGGHPNGGLAKGAPQALRGSSAEILDQEAPSGLEAEGGSFAGTALERERVRPTACINLQKRFGRKYRVTYEESYHAQYGPGARTDDPELMVLLCEHGHIYPFGESTLAAFVDGHPNVAGKLSRIKCCQVWLDGDDGELTVLFDVADFARIAEVMKPRMKRVLNLTPEQREAIGRRLRDGRKAARQAMLQKHPTVRGCTGMKEPEVQTISQKKALIDL